MIRQQDTGVEMGLGKGRQRHLVAGGEMTEDRETDMDQTLPVRNWHQVNNA